MTSRYGTGRRGRGTWRDNTIPAPPATYRRTSTRSPRPNPDWSRSSRPSRDPEYLRRWPTTSASGPTSGSITRCSAPLGRALRRWRVRTSAPGEGVSPAGGVRGRGPRLGHRRPLRPGRPGLARPETFEGTVFHSARWNHDHDLAGKRVAVVGTGASAIQFVPRSSRRPRTSRSSSGPRPGSCPAGTGPSVPRNGGVRTSRSSSAGPGRDLLGREQMVAGFVVAPGLMRAAERLARRHLARSVPDPGPAARLTPTTASAASGS